jgi:RsiW-degrading membrane proteinase PrsW (M82 family)
MHLIAYTNICTGGKCGRTFELKIHHDKRCVPACGKMKIVTDITKNAIQNDIPFFRSSTYTDEPLFFVLKCKLSGFRFAVYAVNSMYYFIQVSHVVDYIKRQLPVFFRRRK